MNIFGKLMASFGILALLGAVIGGVGWFGLHVTDGRIARITDIHLPAVETLGQVQEAQSAIRTAERTILMPTLDVEARRGQLDLLKKHWASADDAIARFDRLPKSEGEEELWAGALAAWDEWKKLHDQMVNLVVLVKDDGVQVLESVLLQVWLDHVKWSADLEKAALEGRAFTGQLDWERCSLGAWQKGFQARNPDLAEAMEDLKPSHEELHRNGAAFNALIARGKTAEARRLVVEKVRPGLEIVEAIFDYALTIVGGDIAMMDAAAEVGFGRGEEAFREASSWLDQLAEVNRRMAEEARIEAGLMTKRGKFFAAFAAVLGGVLAIFFGWLIARSLSHPMAKAVEMIRKMELGHLDGRLEMKREDEIGHMAKAMNAMIESLRRFARSIGRSVGEVESSVLKLNGSTEALAEGADRQNLEIERGARGVARLEVIVGEVKGKVNTLAEALETSSSSAEEMARTVGETSEMADGMAHEVKSISSALVQTSTNIGKVVVDLDDLSASATQVSDTAEALADSSSNVVATAEESMELAQGVTRLAAVKATGALEEVARGTRQNRNLVEEYSRLISSLGNRSAGIGRIIEVIRDMAEQTNLLSLNAAIIAAQAGEHGRGFAVVAEEIRNFSVATSSSAAEIDGVIQVVREELTEAVHLIDDVQQGAASGIVSVSQAEEALKEVVEHSSRSAEMAREICASAGEQVRQSNEIFREADRNRGQVLRIKGMMDEQKLGSDHMVRALEQLQRIADRLKLGTQEQAKAGATVSRALTEMQVFSGEVAVAMVEEEGASLELADALDSLSRVKERNFGVMEELQEVVGGLRGLSAQLVPEVARFKLPDPEPAGEGPAAPVEEHEEAELSAPASA